MNLLIDADALVALSKIDDSNHARALKIAKKIKSASLFASPLAIPEAASVISHRVSQKMASAFLKEAKKKKITVIPLSSELEKLADEIFIAQNKKGTSWPDCLNLAIAQKYGIETIFSFDKIYPRNNLQIFSHL